MIQYIITRNWDASEWSLSELDGHEHRNPSIFEDTDGGRMKKIIAFDAPGWAEARQVFEWAFRMLRRSRIETHQTWEQARLLTETPSEELQTCLFGPNRGKHIPTLRLVTAKT